MKKLIKLITELNKVSQASYLMNHEDDDEYERFDYRGFNHENESESEEPQYISSKENNDRIDTCHNGTSFSGMSRNFAPQAFSSGFSNTSSSVAHSKTHSLGHSSNPKPQLWVVNRQNMFRFE